MKLTNAFNNHFIITVLMVILICTLPESSIAHDETTIFKDLRENSANLKIKFDELCIQDGKKRNCNIDNQQIAINFKLNTLPFRELCDLAGHPQGCENASDFDDKYAPGTTWTQSTCSKTTCYCSDPTTFDVDCTMMMVNHCGLIPPTKIPGSGGVKSCPCVHDCG